MKRLIFLINILSILFLFSCYTWEIRPVDRIEYVDSSIIYRIINVDKWICLENDFADKKPGSSVSLWPVHPFLMNQFWSLEPSGEGLYKIISVDSQLYLDIPGQNTGEIDTLIQTRRKNSDSQTWKIIVSDDGYYKILTSSDSKLCLDSETQNQEKKGNIRLMPLEEGAYTQLWLLEPLMTKDQLTKIHVLNREYDNIKKLGKDENIDEALLQAEELLRVIEDAFGKNHSALLEPKKLLAHLYFSRDWEKAEIFTKDVIDIYTDPQWKRTEPPREINEFYLLYADIMRNIEEYKEAEEYYLELMIDVDKDLDNSNIKNPKLVQLKGDVAFGLAWIYENTNDVEKAEEYYTLAIATMRSLDDLPSNIIKMLNTYNDFLVKQGKDEESQLIEQEMSLIEKEFKKEK